MKAKSIIIILVVFAAIFSSCGDKEVTVNPIPTTAVASETGVDISVVEKPFSNPVFIEGSSFGNFFQKLYKIGRFDDMLKFTSSGTIEKYGKENIRKMYETMAFAYDMKLKSKTGTDTIILNYEAVICATKHMIRIPVVIENDSTKIVLQDLKGLR